MLDLLRPWSKYIDLNSASLRKILTGDQINYILRMCSSIEGDIGLVHTHRNHFNLAKRHCQRALFQARLYEAEEAEMADLLCTALRTNCHLRMEHRNFTDAVVFALEAYNCVAIA
jgi:hypothetical protein